MPAEENYLLKKHELPCGAVIKNRIAKAAMTERLADKRQHATKELENLYKHWAKNGAGLLITGNIQVDKRYKEASANIVVEDESGIESLRNLAKAGSENNTHIWAQISHAGRQSSIFSTFKPIAPSSVQLKRLGLFAEPKAMTLEQIKDVENRFVKVASICKKAGFTGVQIHAAHGYLINQFLTPKTNLRKDEYGGDIHNRSRLLFDIVRRIRNELGDSFPISVKLNSADFQRGGFNEEDFLIVVKELENLNIDLLEISGGTYEDVKFLTERFKRESTRQREAYFMEFASKIMANSSTPLMITGGFRTNKFCQEVLRNEELDMIGFARPFLINRNFPSKFATDPEGRIQDAKFEFGLKKIRDMAEAGYFDYQIHRLASGKEFKTNFNPYWSVIRLTKNEMIKGWF